MTDPLWLMVALTIATAFLSYAGTRGLITYARRTNLLDVPNNRSSHSIPTPRGGGLAIVLTTYLAMATAYANGYLGQGVFELCLAGAPFISLIGWLDDRYTLSARGRLLVQVGCAAMLILFLRLISPNLPNICPELHEYVFWLLSLLFVVWMTNLYNFMDGIDGIASLEALVVLAFFAWSALRQENFTLLLACLILMGSVIGFAVLNWAPARIFMGDVGSGWLGFMLAGITLYAEARETQPLVASLIILGTFIVDATFTLIVRVFTGQKFLSAHRTHAYQLLTQRVWSHSRVALCYALVTVLWLAPLAMMSMNNRDWQIGILALAYLPLIGVCAYLRAGRPS